MNDITKKNFSEFYDRILPYLNGKAHSGFTPVGTIISVMGKTAPMNYLACDGTVYNIADYPELAAYFAEQFEASNYFGGNGTTTFAVPDLRGEFIRGTGTNSHANQGSGAEVGTHQDGTTHMFSASTTNLYGGYSDSSVSNADYSGIDGIKRLKATGTVDSYPNNIYTSRPTNTSVLFCIAAKNIFMDAGMNYSTEEQVVGTWIDGRPIWQKTINDNSSHSFSANTTTDIPYSISDIDQIISYWGTFRGEPLPASSFSGSTMNYHGVVIPDGTNGIKFRLFRNGSAFTGSGIVITVQYVKSAS